VHRADPGVLADRTRHPLAQRVEPADHALA